MPAARPWILRDPHQASAVLDPLRLRLLRHLEFPISASGLARRLRLPRQRVNYHLRELERHGLVRPVRERRVGNCTERLVEAVAARFVLAPELLGPLAAEPRTTAEAQVTVAVREPDGADRRELLSRVETAVRAALEEAGASAGAEAGDRLTFVVGLHPERPRRRLPDPTLPG